MSKTIVITGCSTGFGYDAALRFARRGDRAYATMRDVDGKNREAAGALRQVAADEGIDLRVLDMDVVSEASVNAAAETVIAESGARAWTSWSSSRGPSLPSSSRAHPSPPTRKGAPRPIRPTYPAALHEATEGMGTAFE